MSAWGASWATSWADSWGEADEPAPGGGGNPQNKKGWRGMGTRANAGVTASV